MIFFYLEYIFYNSPSCCLGTVLGSANYTNLGLTFFRLRVKEKLRFSIVKKQKIVSRHLTFKKTLKKTVMVVNKTGIL